MRLKQILFGFSRPVVKATMVITYTYSDAHKLPSANYPQLSVTLDSDQLAIKTQCGVVVGGRTGYTTTPRNFCAPACRQV